MAHTHIHHPKVTLNPHDRQFVYTTTGALLSVYEKYGLESQTQKRDIIYANGEAIAEIDHNENIYELHNDYLGSPRHITSGNQNQSSTGKLVGEQSFGSYGEQMTGIFGAKSLPWGYRPVTGYTGHINEDATGLIYMRGRYYSPLWHRFINSDQGVDANSLNQFAYVDGRPFMATDPSGMAWMLMQHMWVPGYWVDVIPESGGSTSTYHPGYWEYRWVWVPDPPGGGGGGWLDPFSGRGGGGGASGGGNNSKQEEKKNSPTQEEIDRAACKAYSALGKIPTGQTEAYAKLYYHDHKVDHSIFVSHTAKAGERPHVPGSLIYKIQIPGKFIGDAHTHGYTNFFDWQGNRLYGEGLAWANVSSGDIMSQDLLNLRSSYVTSPGLWKDSQIIRYQTDDGVHARYKIIDCSKYR